MDIQKFRSEHASLAAMANEIGTLLVRDTPKAAEVSALRWRLCRELLAHLSAEDKFLYPKLFASPDQATSATAHDFFDEMGHLSKTFTLYMESWAIERISREWNAFCLETSAILSALGARIHKENNTLYVLAERALTERAA